MSLCAIGPQQRGAGEADKMAMVAVALSVIHISFATTSGAWTPVARMPMKREEGAMTLVGERVAYLGGSSFGHSRNSRAFGEAWTLQTESAPFRSAILYDPAVDSWTSLPDMQLPRSAPGACAIGETLYVFGGRSKGPLNTNSVEFIQLDGANPRWLPGPSLPGPNRTSPGAVALPDGSGCVIAGGFASTSMSNWSYQKDAWFFDGNKYTRLPDMHFRRSNMGLVGTPSGVYAIGGSEVYPAYYNASLLSYKKGPGGAPQFGAAWSHVKPLNRARAYPMVGSLVNATTGEACLVAAGGMSLIPMFDPMASVEVYSPSADKWTLHEQGSPGALPFAIGFGSGASLNATHMLVAGGVGVSVTGDEAYIMRSLS